MRRGGWLAASFCLLWLLAVLWPSGVKGEKETEETKRLAVVTADRVNVRQGPGVPYHPVASVHRGDVYRLVDVKDGWLKIEWEKNRTGWLAARYVALAKETAVVQEDRLRLRQEPSRDGRIIGHLAQGETVLVIGEEGGWKQVVTEDAIGWAAASYLAPAEARSISQQTGTVAADSLNVRAEPSLHAPRIGRLVRGEEVDIVEKKPGWYKIASSTGLGGWVSSAYVQVKGGQANEKEAEVPQSAGRSLPSIIAPSDSRLYADSWTSGPVQALAGKTIVLDPGHGGKDGGAKSVAGVKEKELTLGTARLLKNKLQSYGARVVLTRSSDEYVPLSARVAAARLYQADAFISLHYDSAADPDASGITIYYYDRFADYELAQSFQGLFRQLSALPFRGIAFGDYYVLRENEKPSVLLELGYLSNRSDAAVVATNGYQEAVTTAIVNAMRHYFQ
ncbi:MULTISPECIES: N-acetylmuramoyl-L-alanine amidase [Geobacillus]|uniref:N-acetylmuramoyl-L-alanine amidase n=1 Tax=Geobacillus stearothermophilus TaxID=1422 RepID=A0A150MIW5_GEOSE|nr:MULTISPECIES: N-acetylmuramoyl-L-alanine amidase [Geobacillus]KMY58552.1 N-acetylmuramoyl-L-alanine amidase [Geobacillus stearothermophilus]KOR94792.1 N-acetylmuramoyl-L-alanine amidase [Geobacillus stearothermophilus ATCC 12980]KYD24255.1 N-acetylmuramoyl-L-alanine amidase [Geobacillus stearothermophilus]MBR2516384.1 N-acetylmuramoyl-L-alanine amidase [Geobacillus sp.]MED3734588.1 N-acetylmuramoyl-L-alanine amidase [Geobacillus stearothermophilus]